MLILIAFVTKAIQCNSLLAFIGYFYLTLFIIKFFKKQLSEFYLLVFILTSIFLMQSYTIYLCYVGGASAEPIIIIYCLGVISAFLYIKLKSPINLLPFIISCFFVVFMFFQGWDYWIHKSQHGTFTGRITTHKLNQKIKGIDEKNNQISNKILENKIVLLDFWHTKCGVCFQKFPQLQAFYDKYKNDNSILVFAVNKPIEEDKEKSAFKLIEEEGYSFPVLLPTDEELPEKFSVFRFPATFVIDRQGNVVYKGDIKGAIILVEELRNQ